MKGLDYSEVWKVTVSKYAEILLFSFQGMNMKKVRWQLKSILPYVVAWLPLTVLLEDRALRR